MCRLLSPYQANVRPVGVVEVHAIAAVIDDELEGVGTLEGYHKANGGVATLEDVALPDLAAVEEDVEGDGARAGDLVVYTDPADELAGLAAEVVDDLGGGVSAEAAVKLAPGDGEGG